MKIEIFLSILFLFSGFSSAVHTTGQVRGRNILSNSYENALITINAAKSFSPLQACAGRSLGGRWKAGKGMKSTYYSIKYDINDK